MADSPDGRVSLQFLADKSDLAESDVRKRMIYWVSRRVIREVVILLDSAGTGTSDRSPLESSDGGGVDVVPPPIALGYEIIEDQAAEVAKYEAAGRESHNTEFEMTGNEVSEL